MRAKQHYSLTRGLGKPTNQRIAANVSDQSELGIAANQSKAALYSHPQSDQSEQSQQLVEIYNIFFVGENCLLCAAYICISECYFSLYRNCG